MVESDKYEASFKKIRGKLINPVIILSGKSRTAFKGALELNARLMIEGYHPLVVKGNDADDASIISEVAKVMIAKSKISNNNIAIIGNLDEKQYDKKNINGELLKKHLYAF